MSSKITKIITGAAFAFIACAIAFPMSAAADAKSDMDAADSAATEASAQYDAAVAKQEELAAQIDEHNAQIAELENKIPEQQDALSRALVATYKNQASPADIIVTILTEDSLSDMFAIADMYSRIANQSQRVLDALNDSKNELSDEKASLEATKAEQDAAVEAANAAKIEALEKRDAARAAYNTERAKYAASSSTTRRAPTSSVAFDEESARAFIVMKESGGNYNARNGRYIGAYQLTNTYLNGDYSPENQDRVAEQYVKNRYGSWMNAAAFWQTHHWY